MNPAFCGAKGDYTLTLKNGAEKKNSEKNNGSTKLCRWPA
jgi:hypothetical protein